MLHATHDEPDDFAIPATTSLAEQRTRTLKYGDTFAVFDAAGDVRAAEGAAEGVYHRDTRHLSRLELRIAARGDQPGRPPMLLSSTLRDDNAALTVDLTNPDLPRGDGTMLDHDLIHLRRSRFVYLAGCYERLAVRNFSDREQTIWLSVSIGADYADLFEVRGSTRAARGEATAATVGDSNVMLCYTGLDHRQRRTLVQFSPPPDTLDVTRATYAVTLAAGARTAIYMRIDCAPAEHDSGTLLGAERFFTGLRNARRAMRRTAARAASIATSNDIFNEAMRRSVSDLTMLITDTPQGPYPYAGIPWYSTAFGRDGIVTALQTLWMDPAIARGVLRYLAANQAHGYDPSADAQPGKILHETRQGEMAELGEVPFRKYYGTVDATPLFVMLAGAYLERTGDVETVRALWPAIEAALGWMRTDGDPDRDGFIEYARQTDTGLQNQGWKDSFDSVFHADGRAAQGPIALIEVQSYVFAAYQAAARIARAMGDVPRADREDASAAMLREKIDAEFWSDDIGMYALALDGAKRRCAIRTSNAGHMLTTGAAKPDRAVEVADAMLGSAMFSGWGVRTLAADSVRYNPISYHNGSVWPHDNALIGIGLGRYGLREDAARLLEGLFDACCYVELRRLPELLCGFPRRRGQGPTNYPVACAPQAWSATALLSLLQSSLGLGFDPGNRSVVFDRPVMPRFTNEVVLRGLAIGPARIDVALRGHGAEVSMRVLDRSGDIRATLIS